MTSCEKVTGEGPVVSETRNIVNFSGVDFRVAGEVYVNQDPAYKVELNAQQNILNELETYVSNGRLVIRFKNGVKVRDYDPIRIMVSAPEINHLRLSGSGNITGTGILSSTRMDMDISGSGNINVIGLNTAFLDANISGSGNIKVNSGTATEENLKISGSGSIDLVNVAANKATTRTSGSGEMRVNASQSLNVTISGSGSVYYKGTPAVNTSISGSGRVIQI
ncbi:MAG TPA: head GIN domain-containing protein [Flavisolibacter sp.]|nr:head GIN domain-containing protein [Flavisolibacter sp.]